MVPMQACTNISLLAPTAMAHISPYFRERLVIGSAEKYTMLAPRTDDAVELLHKRAITAAFVLHLSAPASVVRSSNDNECSS